MVKVKAHDRIISDTQSVLVGIPNNGYLVVMIGNIVAIIIILYRCNVVSWDFYFRALGSLVVLSFPQLLSFSSVLSNPLSETITSAETAGCPMGQHL
jgi:hypothetical protein